MMKIRPIDVTLVALLIGGCAAKDAKVVSSAESAPVRIAHSIDVDTTRLAGPGGNGDEVVAKLITQHFATVGQVRPATKKGERIEIIVDLPTPNYVLLGSVEKRPDDYCLVVLEILRSADDKVEHIAEAPWWAIDSLEGVYREVRSLSNPRRAAMTMDRFDRLRGQAQDLVQKGRDKAITPDQYARSAKPVGGGDDAPYWAPNLDTPSTLRSR